MADGHDALAGARAAEAKAKQFTQSVEGKEPGQFAHQETTHPQYSYKQSAEERKRPVEEGTNWASGTQAAMKFLKEQTGK